MVPHIQWHERELFERQQHLLHEAEQQRSLKQSSQYLAGRVRQLFVRVSQCFTMLGTETQQVSERMSSWLIALKSRGESWNCKAQGAS